MMRAIGKLGVLVAYVGGIYGVWILHNTASDHDMLKFVYLTAGFSALNAVFRIIDKHLVGDDE